jgi:hypothetical protein
MAEKARRGGCFGVIWRWHGSAVNSTVSLVLSETGELAMDLLKLVTIVAAWSAIWVQLGLSLGRGDVPLPW